MDNSMLKESLVSDDAAAHGEIAPSGFPRKGSCATGNLVLYSVEARYTGDTAKVIAGVLLGEKWKPLHFEKSPIGVPTGMWSPVSVPGLVSYAAAQALRWWFHAAAHDDFADWCLQTRLVEHGVNYHYDATATGACEIVGGRSSRYSPDAAAVPDEATTPGKPDEAQPNNPAVRPTDDEERK